MESINQLTWEWAKSRNIECQYFPETDSTNNQARSEFSNLEKIEKLYIADHQSQGRGRFERTWSNLGQGEILLSTWCFRSNKVPQPLLTPRVGLLLYHCLGEIQKDLEISLKAPNDIFLNNKKLCGLLVEINQRGTLCDIFVGLGLNVFGHPKLDRPAAHLTESLTFTTDLWYHFCDLWVSGLRRCLSEGDRPILTEDERQQLKKAINRGRSANKLLEVSPHCDLIFENQTRSWMDL